ncbi:MAG: hypothetical protein KKB50_10990 [Planctomycetes bacterium]|nr:hypothetical protein [Planctomycetota bacterium]
MGCKRRLLIGALWAVAASGVDLAPARGQQSQPAAASRPVHELPPGVIALLDEIEDYTLGFDNPGYYALLEHVKRSPQAPGHTQSPITVTDWRRLLEQPVDFRGLAITIEGVLGRNKDPYVHKRHRQLGQVWQVELRRHDQPLACTVIFTGDVGDLPLGATLRVTGYFVMIRQYYDASNRLRQAALLVASGPTQVSHGAAHAAKRGELHWSLLIAALLAGLVIVWVLLRRASGPARPDLHTLQAARAAPVNLSEDLASWAEDNDHSQHASPARLIDAPEPDRPAQNHES